MKASEVKKSFDDFVRSYDVENYRQLWEGHRSTFQDFWRTTIQGNEGTSPENDYDPIIKLIDIRARGFNQQTDEAIARINLPQGTWYRIFNDLRKEKDLRDILDQAFNSSDESELIGLINQLHETNEKNKNGLTGEKAAALNALLFLNSPTTYLSSVSLTDRSQILEKFQLPHEEYTSYGEKVILSNRDIILGFQNVYHIDVWPRLLSNFFYEPTIQTFWRSSQTLALDTSLLSIERESESEFALEKHLEDFLVANWEATELGKKYDLIKEKGELVSQQYQTDIGRIDLLVQDKTDKSYVVIELKKGQTNDDTVGQLARYLGWVRENKGDRPVKGIVIVQAENDRLKYALKAIPGAELFVYKINFSLEKINL
ncbi:MAG: DUF1016 family protein [Anaerolineales bacterium]|nr:DUF1016 family protein [Anaerolineales bacterium]